MVDLLGPVLVHDHIVVAVAVVVDVGAGGGTVLPTLLCWWLRRCHEVHPNPSPLELVLVCPSHSFPRIINLTAENVRSSQDLFLKPQGVLAC